ncbi:hypothetical protein CAXC1_160003 [Candidatus Xenohaliotis californiensis]|uniref:Uncharacterized protein n=1 Tax=Candidatus Xenohaliotis californiensis TaxID=84677 RepID=A0ABM9N7B9_9RICK|nr:hypothetical protein CAXC1_160003 [Candidatus Xenohaliotis californiensis]
MHIKCREFIFLFFINVLDITIVTISLFILKQYNKIYNYDYTIQKVIWSFIS